MEYYTEAVKAVANRRLTQNSVKGKLVVCLHQLDNGVVLHFSDSTWIAVRVRSYYEGTEIEFPELDVWNMLEARLLSREEYHAEREALENSIQERAKERRKQQYEALKLEFEGE